MKSKIALIVPWFGKLPEYFELFAKSVAQNPILSYHFWTDRNELEIAPYKKQKNIFFHHISFDEYRKAISSVLGIEAIYDKPYKLCDVKPFLPYIHLKSPLINGGGYLADYKWIGFADIDIVFGDIQSYLEPRIEKIDYFSTHPDRISGHFFFMRNEDKFINQCFKIKNWKQVLSDSHHYGIDEGAFCDVICPMLGIIRRVWHRTSSKLSFDKAWFQLNRLSDLVSPFISNRKHFKELHTTHSAITPDILNYEWTEAEWIYDKGKLYGKNNGKEYPYLHFLFLKNSEYLPVHPTWNEDFYKVVDVDKPILINRSGLSNLNVD